MERPQTRNILRNTTAGILAVTAIGGTVEATHAELKPVAPIVAMVAETVAPVINIKTLTPSQLPDLSATLHTDLANALQDYTGNIDIAIRDRNTGQVIEYTNVENAAGKTYDTASTIKFATVAKLLLVNQANGITLGVEGNQQFPDFPANIPLTVEQLMHVIPTIERSSDDDESWVWTELGGATALDDLYKSIAHTSNTAAEPNGQWGWSQTDALDQINTVALLSDPDSPLLPESKFVLNFLLDHVQNQGEKGEDNQHWGISGGVPKGVTVREKEGWMNYTGKTTGPWTINSEGTVDDGNGNDGVIYDMAVYSEGNETMQSGIAISETAATVVWHDMSQAALTNRPHAGGGR
ncbi:MAG: hypothetical protein JWO07_230 [Candidatus Saccharibacteria bacterium]|nr:hypothetical protein [Candidatus Saccharibacteria bacterium]